MRPEVRECRHRCGRDKLFNPGHTGTDHESGRLVHEDPEAQICMFNSDPVHSSQEAPDSRKDPRRLRAIASSLPNA